MAATSTNMNYREAKAMAAAPTDVNELPNSYVFTIDMPGIKSKDINVKLEDDNVLLVSGKRKRDVGVKFVSTERHVGKFTRKFVLPENLNIDKISANFQKGVLTITVEKLPPPDQRKKPTTIITVNKSPSSYLKKPRTIEVKINCCTII